jgi:hypothetical protein
MTVRFTTFAMLFAVLALGLAVGCGKTGPSKDKTSQEAAKTTGDPHDVVITEADVKKPADYKDAVARIKGYRKEIEVNAGSDTPGKAHRQLDELEIVLKWLPGIARDSRVPKSQWETINTSTQHLRELFEKVHQNIDNKKNPDFPAVAKDVDATIGRLETAANATEAEAKP